MKSLWNRFKYSIQADLHDIFDEKESKNPAAMLNLYLQEAEKKTASVGKLVERQKTVKNKLEKELNEANTMATKRANQLALAKHTGENDLIVFAEAEVTAYDNRVGLIKESLEEAVQELLSLESKFELMKHKIKDMKVRQLSLMGKENVMRANHNMEKIFSPEENEKKTSIFDEVEQYISKLGKKIEKEQEVSSIEDRLEALEKNAEKETEVV